MKSVSVLLNLLLECCWKGTSRVTKLIITARAVHRKLHYNPLFTALRETTNVRDIFISQYPSRGGKAGWEGDSHNPQVESYGAFCCHKVMLSNSRLRPCNSCSLCESCFLYAILKF